MKYLLVIWFMLCSIFSSSAQQTISLCPGERNTFTYFSYSETNGSWFWVMNGDTLSNSKNLTITWTDTGTYVLRVYLDACKTVWDDYVVHVEPCIESDIWFCNAFTPTNDGLNDTWGPIGHDIKEVHYYIYNRWGERIFTGDSMTERWDGTYKNVPVEIGAYVWYAVWKGQDNMWKRRYGHVIVVR